MDKDIEAVIFDVGGVLAYDVWEHQLLDKPTGVAAKSSLDSDEVEKAGKELWNKYANCVSEEKDWQELEKSYWNDFSKEFNLSGPIDTFIKMTEEYFIQPVTGMVGLVRNLKEKGVCLAICSNNNEFWFRRQKETLCLQEFFDDDKIILSCRHGCSKSDSSGLLFTKALDAVKVNGAKCVFIDDRIDNIKRACEHGMQGIHFPTAAPYGAEYLKQLLAKMGLK